MDKSSRSASGGIDEKVELMTSKSEEKRSKNKEEQTKEDSKTNGLKCVYFNTIQFCG